MPILPHGAKALLELFYLCQIGLVEGIIALPGKIDTAVFDISKIYEICKIGSQLKFLIWLE